MKREIDMNNKTTGNLGERLAKEYLIKNDYIILEINFTTKIGEIDIIAKRDDIVIFIEVKTRKSLKYGRPYEAVDYRKTQKIIKVAQNYIVYKAREDTQYRFDVIEVLLNEKIEINHIKDAFWAQLVV